MLINATDQANSSLDAVLCDSASSEDKFTLFKCYGYFARKSLVATVLELSLGIGTVAANVFTFFLILTKDRRKFVFDRILMAHTIVDLVVGGIDLPIYHIFTIFGYWPFSRAFCILWNTLDSSINTIGMLHMVFMSYSRLRSMRNPHKYSEEIVIKHPFLACLFIWIISVIFWAPVNYVFIGESLPEEYCYIPYNPQYLQLIFTFFTWFIPLCYSLFSAIYIHHYLHNVGTKKSRKRISTSFTRATSGEAESVPNHQQKKSTRLFNSPEKKLTIIMVVYLAQWLPSCIIFMLNSMCSCVPDALSTITYWLTFSVSFTDPIVILLLNPNYLSK